MTEERPELSIEESGMPPLRFLREKGEKIPTASPRDFTRFPALKLNHLKERSPQEQRLLEIKATLSREYLEFDPDPERRDNYFATERYRELVEERDRTEKEIASGKAN